jgi:cobalt-zinc-cadmium efflux system protein
VLWWTLGINSVLLVAEVIGGFVFSSLALLADAAHMGSDVAGLAIALVAQRLALRPHSPRHTYGLQRAEVIGALINAVSLIVVAVWIVVAAIGRLGDVVDVDGAGLLAVATLGLAVNVISAIAIHGRAGDSLNMQGAFLHMVLDAVGSVGAMAAGAAVVLWDADWVDPTVSIGIAALVVAGAFRLVMATLHVLLEGTPPGIETAAIAEALTDDPEVAEVHHLHVWNLASDVTALSAHVVLREDMPLHDAQLNGDRLKLLLKERFGIEHATLELECHVCE